MQYYNVWKANKEFCLFKTLMGLSNEKERGRTAKVGSRNCRQRRDV